MRAISSFSDTLLFFNLSLFMLKILHPVFSNLVSLSVSSPGSACLFHSVLLALIRVVVQVAGSLHSQDSLLPLCPHAFMPAVVTSPQTCFSPQLLTQNTFLTQALAPGRISLLMILFLFNSFLRATFLTSMYEEQTPAMLTWLQTLRARFLPLYFTNDLSGPNSGLHEVVSASRLYLHASSGCGAAGVHGLDVTGFAAPHHKAPAHSIANNLGAEGDVREADLWKRSNTVRSVGRGAGLETQSRPL